MHLKSNSMEMEKLWAGPTALALRLWKTWSNGWNWWENQRKSRKSYSIQVACASFDYMKLMVVEMQQQLAELEDRERIGGAGEGGGDPKPPPRGRANPFNSGGEVLFWYVMCVYVVCKNVQCSLKKETAHKTFSSRGGRWERDGERFTLQQAEEPR